VDNYRKLKNMKLPRQQVQFNIHRPVFELCQCTL
jgi:hypothetical protein